MHALVICHVNFPQPLKCQNEIFLDYLHDYLLKALANNSLRNITVEYCIRIFLPYNSCGMFGNGCFDRNWATGHCSEYGLI